MKRQWGLAILILVLSGVSFFACGESGETEGETNMPWNVYDDTYVVELSENRSTLHDREGRPKEFNMGNTYDDLTFYTNMEETNEEKLESLPDGKIIIDSDLFIEKGKNRKSEYGVTREVFLGECGFPFDKALHVSVTKRPDLPYHFQFNFGKEASLANIAKENANLLISFWLRSVNCAKAEIGIVIEKNGSDGTYNKLISEVVQGTEEWQCYYISTPYSKIYQNLNIRLGYDVQELEIGGFTVTEYDPDIVDFKSMPNHIRLDYLEKDAVWRKEAFARIEEIRKGDIRIIVTDSNGKPIPDAKVDLEMFEHEFEWGCGINSNVLRQTPMLKNLTTYFNAAVMQNDLKWNRFEKDSETPTKILDTLHASGIDRVRGHCLYWDRIPKQKDETSIPSDLPALDYDRDALMKRINIHIQEEMKAFDGRIMEWDVLNEACNNVRTQKIHGRELIAEWYRAARESGTDALLYYNDCITSKTLFDLLDTMKELGVDYDGIGIQSHYAAPEDMNDIYDFYCRLAKYGKRLKVTEYTLSSYNDEVQASFTRDLMILAFSIEQMDGFYHWGMNGGENNQFVSFTGDWTPRKALSQMQDLIYNKWWTKDSGRTNAVGSVDFRGFYGAYYVTVIAKGVKKTVAVDCFKGQENTISIVIPQM